MILGHDDPPIIADIPSTYHMQNIPQTFQNPEPPPQANPPPISPMLSPLLSPTWHYPQPNFNQPPGFVGMMHQPQFFPYNNLHPPMANSGYHPIGQFSTGGSVSSNDHTQSNSATMSSISSASPIPSPISSPRNPSPNYHNRILESSPHEKMGWYLFKFLLIVCVLLVFFF